IEADVELAQPRVHPGDECDLAVDDVVAADHSLPVEDALRLCRPVGGYGVDENIAAVLDTEDDPLAAPDRLACLRIRRALPVERNRQEPLAAAVRVHDADLRVMR